MTRSFRIAILLGAAAALLLLSGSPPVRAAAYPSRAIDWVVMWPAGGGADTATRTFTKYLEPILGQKVIIKNLPGGGGSIGFVTAKQARADGYTLVTIQGDLPKFKPTGLAPIDIGDFDIMGGFSYQSPIILARKDAPWNSIEEFAADAKKNPGKRTIGVSDIGGVHHQPVVLWAQQAGITVRAIAHEGSPQMNAAILGGHVDLVSSYVRPAIPYIKEGQLKFLGYFGSRRLDDYPSVPTFKELGYNVVWEQPYGIGAPRGVPEDVKKLLSQATQKVWGIPGYREDIAKLGLLILDRDGPTLTQELLQMQENIAKVLALLKR
jgi:tripartite-type tricarboxylate transporter receptor subunit TctC